MALEGLCDRVVLGLVDTPNCVTKVFLCWCTVGCLGQHKVVPVGPSYESVALVWLVVCGGCVV